MLQMRAIWAAVGIVGLVIVGAAVWFRGWAHATENSGSVAYWGLVTSLAGLYVSVVGFTLALEQIAKSRSAAEAAEHALSEIRGKLSSLSATGDLERAKLALEALDAGVYDGRPKEARVQLGSARIAFVRISELHLDVFEEIQDQVAAVPAEIADAIDVLDGGAKEGISKIRGILRSHLDLVNRMQVRITRG